MALISAAFCPHPMMLIPAIAGEAAGGWEQLRAACTDAIRQLVIPVWDGRRALPADAPQLVAIVGGDDTTRSFDPAAAYGSLRSSGVIWEHGWGLDNPEARPLPLPLTIGDWLVLNSTDPGMIVADTVLQTIDFDASPQECAVLGQDLAGRADRVAMLVMGEGSTALAAGDWPFWGEQARLCDANVSRALEQADVGALSRLAPVDFRATATGRAAWQVLAGAAGGRRFRGRLHMGTADSDLGYFVASWTRG